jgi:hypothetical protein
VPSPDEGGRIARFTPGYAPPGARLSYGGRHDQRRLDDRRPGRSFIAQLQPDDLVAL